MKIIDILIHEAILPNLIARDKKGIIEELVTPIARTAKLNKEEIMRVLLERERLGSTGIGGGAAIPHGKMKNLDNLLMGFGISRQGINFESIDGKLTHIFFLLITPENSTGLHLHMLARISRLLKNEPFKQRLSKAADREELFSIIKEEDGTF